MQMEMVDCGTLLHNPESLSFRLNTFETDSPVGNVALTAFLILQSGLKQLTWHTKNHVPGFFPIRFDDASPTFLPSLQLFTCTGPPLDTLHVLPSVTSVNFDHPFRSLPQYIGPFKHVKALLLPHTVEYRTSMSNIFPNVKSLKISACNVRLYLCCGSY